MGFVQNVGQQNPSYVKGRQASRCKESCWWWAAWAMEEALLHMSLPEHRWQWTQTHAERKRQRAPVMKTVLSLHRKWAHAVKTIRILQGLVSLIVQLWLQFDQICDLTFAGMGWVQLVHYTLGPEEMVLDYRNVFVHRGSLYFQSCGGIWLEIWQLA